MKSLHTRLDPIKEEVLAYIRQRGRLKSMEEYGVKDYARFHNWIMEVTNDPQYGFEASCRADSDMSSIDRLLDRFLAKVAKLEAANKALRERVKLLQWQVDQREEINAKHVSVMTQAFED